MTELLPLRTRMPPDWFVRLTPEPKASPALEEMVSELGLAEAMMVVVPASKRRLLFVRPVEAFEVWYSVTPSARMMLLAPPGETIELPAPVLLTVAKEKPSSLPA